MRQARGSNPKRKVIAPDQLAVQQREELASKVVYKGSPYHKMRPNDYGLTPATNPRPGATLCDVNGPFPKAVAEALLRSGAARGMISERQNNGWPQNIWAVSDDGEVYEAELENQLQGHYHGYPMLTNDEFRSVVLKEWERR